MKYNSEIHKCAIVIDKDLSRGLAINAASVIGISFGRTVTNLVGPDMQSMDNVNYPGVIYSPLPILLANNEHIQKLSEIAEKDEEVYSVPFSALAQSCKTYDEYGEKISSVNSEHIELVAVGIIGPKKTVNKHTGNLALFK